LNGGEGDDEITSGAGDISNGNGGDDTFFFNPGLTEGPGAITVVGGETGEINGDTLDLTGLSNVDIMRDAVDPEAGSATYTDANGDTVTINYSEIENLVRDNDAPVLTGNASAAPNGPQFAPEFGVPPIGVDHDFLVLANPVPAVGPQVQIEATDAQNDELIFSITGGEDAALFDIDPDTGILSLVSLPADRDTSFDNDDFFEVEITVTDEDFVTDTAVYGFDFVNGI
jgi:hypothetical protein